MTVAGANTRSIIAMNLAMLGFVVNDTMVKVASESLPLGQTMFTRGLIASALLVGLCLATGAFARLAILAHPMVIWRVVGELGATLTYLTGLFHMPIGSVTAIFQCTPLAVTAAAAIFLGERVGWRRWMAIAIGFAGVLIIVRPGASDFNIFAISVLISVGFVALRDLATARMPAEVPTFLASLLTAVVITATGLALKPFEGWFSAYADWQPLTPSILMVLAGAAVFLIMGYVFIIVAMRTGEMSVVAPFRYTILVFALGLGFLVFGEVPDAITLVGAAIVVATGIYTFYRERLHGQAPAATSSIEPNA